MSATDAAARAAQLLCAVRAGAPRLAGLPAGLAPATLAEAYAIQAQVLARLGGRRGGWKATLFAPGEGICAPIPADALLAGPAAFTPATAPTRAPPGAQPALRVEPEVAFRLARDLPPRAAGSGWSVAEVTAAVGSAHAALELVSSRYADESAVSRLEQVADAYTNEALVIGPPCTAWQRLDLRTLPLSLALGGRRIDTAQARHPLGDPFEPLAWIANHLSALGIGLAAGEVVTTGSWAGAPALAPGEEAVATFTGLGEVRFRYG